MSINLDSSSLNTVYVLSTFPKVAFCAGFQSSKKTWVSNPDYAFKFESLSAAIIASWGFTEPIKVLTLAQAHQLIEG